MERTRCGLIRARIGSLPGGARRRLHGGREARRRQLRAGEGAAARRGPGDASQADRRWVVVDTGSGPVERQLESSGLPELGEVWWRSPMDERRLEARERISTAFTAVYVLPFC